MKLNTFKLFNDYGWAYYYYKGKWGNTTRFAWLAKILHKINGDKPFKIL